MIIRPNSGIFTPWWYTFPNASNYTVTGSGAVWGDVSDATYVQFVGNDFSPMPTAQFPAVDTTATTQTVWVRCQGISGSVYVGWELRDADSGELFSQHSTPDVLAPGVATDIEIPFDADNGEAYLALLGGRLTVTVEAMGGTGTVRIFEAWIEIPDDVPATRLRRRPLRQFPRSDGLGMASTRRQDANRSMQASLRRGGGVYF